MRAGALRKRGTLERPTETADAAGQMIPEWEEVATLYGSLRGSSAKEIDVSRQMAAIATHTWIQRFQGDATDPETAEANPRPGDRIVIGSRVLNVLGAVDWDDAHREVRVLCNEVQAGA